MKYLGIVAVVLGIVILYFLFRLRHTMRSAPGANSKMNTIELIKNWQEQKATEAQYQAGLREKARRAAQPEIERVLTEKYTQEAIAEATATKGDKFKQNLKSGLGLDSDKIFSEERIDRMVGKSSNTGTGSGLKNAVGNSGNMFSEEKIARMTGKGTTMDPDRIKAASGSLNWSDGVKRGLDSEAKFSGVDRMLGREPPKRRTPRR